MPLVIAAKSLRLGQTATMCTITPASEVQWYQGLLFLPQSEIANCRDLCETLCPRTMNGLSHLMSCSCTAGPLSGENVHQNVTGLVLILHGIKSDAGKPLTSRTGC